VDPRIPTIRQVFDVGELPPSQIEARPRNGRSFLSLVPDTDGLGWRVSTGLVFRLTQ